MKLRRPFGVKLLAILIFAAALWHLLRLVEAILFWEVLEEYHALGGPLYLVISGGVWVVVSVIVSWAAWRGKPWAWGAALGLAAGLGSWTWYDQLVMQTGRTNGLFSLAMTILSLAAVCLLLFSKKVRSFYHEQSSEG